MRDYPAYQPSMTGPDRRPGTARGLLRRDVTEGRRFVVRSQAGITGHRGPVMPGPDRGAYRSPVRARVRTGTGAVPGTGTGRRAGVPAVPVDCARAGTGTAGPYRWYRYTLLPVPVSRDRYR
jgi:hypothetical protein